MGILRGTALVAVVLWACTACTNTGGTSATIDASQLIGVWTNASGANISFAADRHASATGLQYAVSENQCGSSFADGRWEFFVPVKGGDIGSSAVTDGKTLGLNSGAEGGCMIMVDVRRDGKQYDLCLKMDADTGCTDDELLHKK